jgi:DNA repair exonuclease SbcCD ATPase subunit
MATMTAPTIDETSFAHRWLESVQQGHPQIPEPLLHCFFESEAQPTAEAITACLGCDVEQAEAWRRVLDVHLISPSLYVPLFAAEDALSERRMQQQNYQADCRATSARLAELQRQIEGTLAYSHLDQSQAAEVKERLEDLDRERVDLLRHQADLPGVGQLIEHALNEARAQLTTAQQALQEAQVAHLQDVEDCWLQEGLALLEPVRTHVYQAQWLDAAWERLGIKPSVEQGSGRLRDVLVQRLRSREPA